MTSNQLRTGVAVAAGLGVITLFFVGANPLDTFSNSAISGTGLITQDLQTGSGEAAEPGDTLTVHYTGTLENGTVFDTTVGGTPFSFVLGSGTVIAGWEQGLLGLREGGRRLLVVPSSLGYGATGYGPIPPNATLIFEVELLDLE